MAHRTYQLKFFEEDDGHSPVHAFLEGLSAVGRYALGSAMDGLLQEHGPELARILPQYASALGNGLYEFRLEDVTKELLEQLGKKVNKKLLPGPSERFLFRVFFHPYGQKLLLLLGAYDKAERSSAQFQNARIEEARKRLAAWKRKEASKSKVRKRSRMP